jgi:hypothetical protein
MKSQASSMDAETANAIFQAKLSANPLLLRAHNDKLQLAERSFLWLQGAPGREWTRHLIWATRCAPTHPPAYLCFSCLCYVISFVLMQ